MDEDEGETWREHPDLLGSLDALDSIALDDDGDLSEGTDSFAEGEGGGDADMAFVPMADRPWAKGLALFLAIAVAGLFAYGGVRVILDWLGA